MYPHHPRRGTSARAPTWVGSGAQGPRRWPHNGSAREVPAPPSARGVRMGPHVGPTTAWRAKYPRRPRRVASARAPTLALAHKDPDIGRGARPARPLGTPRPRAARLSDATRRGRRGYFARRRAAGLGMRDFASELFRREIPRPLHPRPHGRAARVAAGHRMGPHPPRHGPAHTPPTARRAKYPRRPRRVASARPPLPRVGPDAQWPRRGAQWPPPQTPPQHTPCRNRRTH